MRDVGKVQQQVFRVEIEQARVIAHEPAAERAARQLGEVLVLERLHLSWRELQLLCDLVQRQARGLARGPQARTRTSIASRQRHGVGISGQAFFGGGHSQPSVLIALVSGASG